MVDFEARAAAIGSQMSRRIFLAACLLAPRAALAHSHQTSRSFGFLLPLQT